MIKLILSAVTIILISATLAFVAGYTNGIVHSDSTIVNGIMYD